MTKTGLKGFRQVMSLHARVRIILQRHLQLVPLLFIERTRLEAGGIDQRVLAAFAPGFFFGRSDELAAHAGSAYGVAHPEIVDIQPVAFAHPNEPAEHGAVFVPHVNANIAAKICQIEKLSVKSPQPRQ